jgi:replication-associated recombination protein RarA
MNPLTYNPQTPADFIGEARNIAGLLVQMVADSRANKLTPLKLLFNGPPGTGKSALVAFLQTTAGIHPKWSTTKTNGTKVNMEAIQEMEDGMHYRDLYGDYKLFWIDEVDKMGPTQQCRFLSTLDDMPGGVIVACTSNCKVKDFEPRFQSRFQLLEVPAVHAAQIETLLARFLDGTTAHGAAAIKQIATFACGNVRQALLDAKAAMLMAQRPA